MKDSIKNILLNDFYRNTSENSKKLYLKDINKFPGYETHFYNELSNTIVKGFPIGSDFVDSNGVSYTMENHKLLSNFEKKDYKLRYHYLPNTHELYVGSTGCGKTTGAVEPILRAISKQKNKVNLFITDPKGELYSHNAEFLIKEGYNVYILNFKETSRSDKWNPFSEIIEVADNLKKLCKSPKLLRGKPPKNSNFIITEELKFNYYYLYDNYIFNNLKSANMFINSKIDALKSKATDLITSLATVICPEKDKTDPTWCLGARQTYEGILLTMLDMYLDESSGFTSDMYSIKTSFEFYNYLANKYIFSNSLSNKAYDSIFYKKYPQSFSKTFVTMNSADTTAKGYAGVFQSIAGEWDNDHILTLTTGNTIKLDNLNNPFAIFIAPRDYEKKDFQIASLFINYVYRHILNENDKLIYNGITPRATHFLLDEFANIPKIEGFDNKISTARSRNIWLHLFVQSYEQIDEVYSPQIKNTILCNCTSHIYMGTQDYNSATTFIQQCGDKTTPTLNNDFTKSYIPIKSSVIKHSDLNLIRAGEFYNKRLFMPVFLSTFIRSYYLNKYNYYEYFHKDDLLKIAPVNMTSYKANNYNFDFDSFETNKKLESFK